MAASAWPSLVRLGLHAKLIIGGGPHIRTRVSGPAGGRCSAIIVSVMKPEEYFQRSGGRSTVYHTLKRLGYFSAYPSSKLRTRMSSSVWLAYSSEMVVASVGSLRMAAATCSIGVMPVPPDIMASALHCFSFVPILNLPWPRYSFMPNGPEISTLSPTLRLPMYCDILPPSGKRSITPLLYTLITRSTWPTSSSEVVGVYLRSISAPSSLSSLPFHSPLTEPAGFGQNTLKCLPTGKPRMGRSLGSVRRSRSVSCESSSRSPRTSCCLCLLRNLAFARGRPIMPMMNSVLSTMITRMGAYSIARSEISLAASGGGGGAFLRIS
mmetsp:Transcript_69965/g.138698  ORF Transcript_69965/g.138698 Transcript_69965/m.138698 type:complete len:323 (+) Transcript_69965:452-1420(+)